MGFQQAVEKINEIKKLGLIEEYAIGGAYAVTLYDVPQATYDLDVFVTLSSDRNFGALCDHFRESGAIIKHEHIFIGDMPVQFLPNLGPLYHHAVEEAQIVKFAGISARFISLEHLIALLLKSFRPKDKIRIRRLLNKANNKILTRLIERFDDEKKTLSKRYRTILEETS